MPDIAALDETAWFTLDGPQATELLETDASSGLTADEASSRLAEIGPNQLQSEPPPSKLQIARGQVVDPMNLMLIGVAIISIVIGEISTGVLVGMLVLLNVVLGASQELKALAAVDALAKLQVPAVRVVRDAKTMEVPAPDVVPGDIVLLEAGDLVPADGRILRSTNLESQEASLTGESAPIPKGALAIANEDADLGDRTSMLFQNTSVTRGTGSMVVTATGMSTEMGRIAEMLSSVERTRSPLQKELDSLTKILGTIAWGAVAVIVAIGWSRDMETGDLLLLGTAMAISAIPTGLPTFVQGMLSYGSRQLAEAKAVVKNLTDVETLGSTSAINTDKTGTLTMNEMMASLIFHAGSWYKVGGSGYEKTGDIRAVAGVSDHDFTSMAYALVLDSDATVSDRGDVVGDPTEAALVVLAAKLGVSANETRRAYPRLAEVPFDSDYKFMATVHRVAYQGEDRLLLLTKGAPDVVLTRCSEAITGDGGFVSIGDAVDGINEANARMGGEGLRVLSLAFRIIEPDQEQAAIADPMSFVTDLAFVSLIGIIDPLRPSSKTAVTLAHEAGIDVRMITGDHVVTALAIGKDLGLGAGSISGREFRALSDDEVIENLDELHVFGRVAPEDKLRLVQIMQGQGLIVAMTGDAVNDAAALKQADIGVAMGSGSEVTKQAAKMILTDDNFGTLVHAIELGRSIYQKISLYVRYQMSQLMALVILFLTASLLNIAGGVALTPMMVLFINFFIASAPVLVILLEEGTAGLMQRPPRDPSIPLTNRREVTRWLTYGGTLFLVTLAPLLFGPDEPSSTDPTASMTMAYAVMCVGTLMTGLSLRRDPETGLTPPAAKALGILAVPLALTVLTTTWEPLQRLLGTQRLTGEQWLIVFGLALVVLVVVEIEKGIRRSRLARSVSSGPETI
jgi:Ca2+-transporting ATPase